jgi:hypothetical protein
MGPCSEAPFTLCYVATCRLLSFSFGGRHFGRALFPIFKGGGRRVIRGGGGATGGVMEARSWSSSARTLGATLLPLVCFGTGNAFVGRDVGWNDRGCGTTGRWADLAHRLSNNKLVPCLVHLPGSCHA